MRLNEQRDENTVKDECGSMSTRLAKETGRACLHDIACNDKHTQEAKLRMNERKNMDMDMIARRRSEAESSQRRMRRGGGEVGREGGRLDEDAVGGGHASAHKDGRRSSQAQRAGAGYNQDRYAKQ